MIFLDTSAVYALADRADEKHARAVRLFAEALASREGFLTHSYVLVESIALIQHRLGADAALAFAEDAQKFQIEWIGRALHDEAVAWLRANRRRQVSLVDAVTFAVMRARHVRVAFAFDPHFAQQGFRLFGERP